MDEGLNVFSYGRFVIVAVQPSLCFYKVHYPFREGLRAYGIEQGRQLEMGMDIDETVHEDCVIQLGNAMAWIFLDYPV